MARLPRLVIPHQPHHVIQSGNGHQTIFCDTDDFSVFLGYLREAAKQARVAVHAYVLLPDHMQLLVTPSDSLGLGRMMQWIGRHYVPYFNAKYQRAGTLWQGRYKATVIESQQYFLACSKYIELYPERRSIAAADYPWSSLAHHVGIKPDPVITDHPVYWALGNTPFDREAAYRHMIEQGLTTELISTLDNAVRKGWPLGSDAFKSFLAKQTSRRVEPAKRGRPAKQRLLKDTPASSP